MELNWARIARTAVQSASGRGDRAYHGDKRRLEARGGRGGVCAFACTVAIAVLMNINKQAKEDGEDGKE